MRVIDVIRELLWGPAPLIAIQQALGSAWIGLFESLTLLGNAQGIVIVAAVALWLGGRRQALEVLAITLLALAISSLFWFLLPVPRPDDPRVMVIGPELPTPSFPSGHVATMTTLWGELARRGWLPGPVVALGVIVVMTSRLYLGLHYLGDVLAGLLLGVALLVLVPRFWSRRLSRLSHLPYQHTLALGMAGWLVAAGSLVILPAYRFEEAGMLGGLILGLPLEYGRVRYSPVPVSGRQQALKVGLGLAGMLVLLVAARLFGGSLLLLSAALAMLSALWGVLVAPALFVRLGLTRDSSCLGQDHL